MPGHQHPCWGPCSPHSAVEAGDTWCCLYSETQLNGCWAEPGSCCTGWVAGWLVGRLLRNSRHFYWRSKETNMEQGKGLAGLFLVISLLQGKSLLECLTALGRLMRRRPEQGGRVIGILMNLEPSSPVILEVKKAEAKNEASTCSVLERSTGSRGLNWLGRGFRCRHLRRESS